MKGKGSISETLAKGLVILDLFGTEDAGYNLGEIAAKVGISKTSAHRYVNTYCEQGYLARDPRSGLYKLGVRTLSLALAMIVVAGGLGSLTGSILAGIGITVLLEWLRFVENPVNLFGFELPGIPGMEIQHHRTLLALPAKEAGIVVTFEARDREHGQTVLTALREAGFTPEIV